MKNKLLYIITPVLIILFSGVTKLNLVYADTLSDECDYISKQLRKGGFISAAEKQQITRELEQNLSQCSDSPAKAKAYLLAAYLNIGGDDSKESERLLNEALAVKQIQLFDEIQVRSLLGNILLTSRNNTGASQQYKQVIELANKCLRSGELRSVKSPFADKQAGQLVAGLYGTATRRMSELLTQENKMKEAAGVLDDYAKNIIEVVPSFDGTTRNYMIRSAVKAWVSTGTYLQKVGLSLDARDIYTKSLEKVTALNMEGDSELLEIACFQLECGKTLTEQADPKNSLQNFSRLLEMNKSKSWVVNASLELTDKMDPILQYGFLSKLILTCGDNCEYQGIANLYFKAGLSAYTLGIYNQASKYFKEFLRKFSDDTRCSYVEDLIRSLPPNSDGLDKELLEAKQYGPNSPDKFQNTGNTASNITAQTPPQIEINEVIRQMKETKSLNPALPNHRWLFRWFVLIPACLLFLCSVLWHYQKNKCRKI